MARILMVDDSNTSRRILGGILKRAGHEIVGEGVNGEDGYLKFKYLHPDLVTLDITMPKMDGLEALKLIRKDDEKAKVILISAESQEQKMVEGLRCGASEFVMKPYDADEVIRVVDKVLSKPY